MNALLDLAIKAHGGLDRWDKVNSIKVDAAITGAIWLVKGRVDVLKNVIINTETKRERLTMDFPGQNKQTIFEPHRVVVQTAVGEPITVRNDPKKSFEGQTFETPWDDVDVAYFSGEAMWTYLTIPFVYTRPGFETEEMSFPENVRSHTQTQISCFGPDGLLRRHDYTVDILGGAKALNYASDYRSIDGIVFPTARRVVAYQGDYQPLGDPVLVAIDMKEIALL